jgi:hypothetical protein
MKIFLIIFFIQFSVHVFSQSISFKIDTIELAESDTANYHFYFKAEHNNKKFLSQPFFFMKNDRYPYLMEYPNTTVSYEPDFNEFKIYIDESGSYIQINLNTDTSIEYLLIPKLIIYKNLANTHFNCNTVYYDDRKRKLKVIKRKSSAYDENSLTQLSVYTLNINGKNYTCKLMEKETTGWQTSNGVYTKLKLSKKRQQKFMRHHRVKTYCSVTKKVKTGIIQL